MKKITVIISSVCLIAAVAQQLHADTTIPQLNTEIQAQLKQIQDTQNKQLVDLNTKLQAQIKQTQTQLQAQMASLNQQTQNQLLQVKTSLEKQTADLQKELTQLKK